MVLIGCLVLSVTFGTIFAANPPTADEVLALLKEGNERYANARPTYPHEGAARRREVAVGQHPLATAISCSDSRVPPEILFDEGLGDLFIHRRRHAR